MAKINYSFEKRQREIAKKKKKEAKRLQKEKPVDNLSSEVETIKDNTDSDDAQPTSEET